jgi:hypothetical protein
MKETTSEKKNAIKLEGMNLQINNNQEKYETHK